MKQCLQRHECGDASEQRFNKYRNRPIQRRAGLLHKANGIGCLLIKTLKVSEPPKRSAGVKVADVAALVDKLKNEAKVI